MSIFDGLMSNPAFLGGLGMLGGNVGRTQNEARAGAFRGLLGGMQEARRAKGLLSEIARRDQLIKQSDELLRIRKELYDRQKASQAAEAEWLNSQGLGGVPQVVLKEMAKAAYDDPSDTTLMKHINELQKLEGLPEGDWHRQFIPTVKDTIRRYPRRGEQNITLSQFSGNETIETAREILKGYTAEQVRDIISPTTGKYGRQNPNYDPTFSRQVLQPALKRKIGQDPEFDALMKKYGVSPQTTEAGVDQRVQVLQQQRDAAIAAGKDPNKVQEVYERELKKIQESK